AVVGRNRRPWRTVDALHGQVGRCVDEQLQGAMGSRVLGGELDGGATIEQWVTCGLDLTGVEALHYLSGRRPERAARRCATVRSARPLLGRCCDRRDCALVPRVRDRYEARVLL